MTTPRDGGLRVFARLLTFLRPYRGAAEAEHEVKVTMTRL